MVRSRLTLGALAAFGVSCLTLAGAGAFQAAATGKAAPVTPAVDLKAETPKPFQQVWEKLSQPVNLVKGIDPNTPLKDTLEFLSELHGVPLVVDTPAFKADGMAEPEQVPIGVPKSTNVSFRSILHRLLAKMEPPATFVIRYDHLVVLPRNRARPDAWTAEHRSLAPVVDVQFDRRPLDLALRDVSHMTGVNVVLDARVAEKARVPVTATFTQTAVDTAVQLLADMADLKALAVDTVLYVTTHANAEALETEMEKRELKRSSPLGGLGG